MRRRKFLRHITHSMAIPGLAGSLGLTNGYSMNLQKLLSMASAEGKVLVLIFLEGGNYGLNTVIPLNRMSAMSQVRPHVFLPESRLLKLPGKDLALHPALKNLRSLYTENRLGIVQSVGYPDQNFSHFRSTDIWMSGSNSDELINNGWIGRHLASDFQGYPEQFPNEEHPDPLAIEIGNGGSLLFQGPEAAMSMVLSGADSFYKLLNNEEEEAPATKAGDKLRFIRLIARQAEQYGDVVLEAARKANNLADYEADDLSQQLQIVARLIAGGLQTPLYMVRLGGFDTHDNQVESSDHTLGEHTELLKALDDGIMSFMTDLEQHNIADRVVGMTFSEFGRRITSNASLGTDHGTAAPLFVFGNKVQGDVLGENPIFSESATYQDNIAMQYDFRQVYASMLSQWFEKDDQSVENTLLRNFEQIPLIGDGVITSVSNDVFGAEISVYPNPIQETTIIRYIADGSPVKIDLYGINGQLVERIYRGAAGAGKNEILWHTSQLQPGQYVVRLQGEKLNGYFKVIK